MTTQGTPEEVGLLRELLSDAHSRIRDLQVQVQRLAAALLTRSLSDRRRAVEPHPERRTGLDRRRMAAWTPQPRLDLYRLGLPGRSRDDSSREG